jgi:hypothetical protein
MKITINPVLDMETLQWVGNEGTYEYDGPLARFDRAAQGAAKTAVTNANNTAGGYGAGASGIASTLVPALQQEATHPTGFNPSDINSMLVAGEQGAGGANSGITGEANLHAARTRNAGGFSGALDQAARIKGQQLSQNALGVQNENANLKQKQMQAGLEGLQNMYGTDVGAQMKSMGMVPEDINAQVNAGKSGWLQNAEGVIKTITGGAKDAAGAYSDVENA